MSLFRTWFRAVGRESLRIVDERQHPLVPRYGGSFHVKRLTVFDDDGRFRGFVFAPGNPTAARIQSFVAGARRSGLIPEDLVRVLFARIQTEDFIVKTLGTRDVLVFPADIYHTPRGRHTVRLPES